MTDTLPTWSFRPEQTAALLNPATLAAVIAWCTRRYQNERESSMPWELSHIAVPLALHRSTREAMPKTVQTHFAAWVAGHTGVLTGFGPRARAFAPYVGEGLRHGLRTGILAIDNTGHLSAAIPTKARPAKNSEQADIVRAAGIAGVWFARAGAPANVFIQLGVKP